MKNKELLLKFMHYCGFDWICDIDFINGCELVDSKRKDGSLWWRDLEVEGSGFTQLFKGSIKNLYQKGDL